MASYLDGKIGHWPEITDTLLRIRDDRYPDGWLDPEGMTSHNNYDVVTLFRFAWPEMRPEQRARVAMLASYGTMSATSGMTRSRHVQRPVAWSG